MINTTDVFRCSCLEHGGIVPRDTCALHWVSKQRLACHLLSSATYARCQVRFGRKHPIPGEPRRRCTGRRRDRSRKLPGGALRNLRRRRNGAQKSTQPPQRRAAVVPRQRRERYCSASFAVGPGRIARHKGRSSAPGVQVADSLAWRQPPTDRGYHGQRLQTRRTCWSQFPRTDRLPAAATNPSTHPGWLAAFDGRGCAGSSRRRACRSAGERSPERLLGAHSGQCWDQLRHHRCRAGCRRLGLYAGDGRPRRRPGSCCWPHRVDRVVDRPRRRWTGSDHDRSEMTLAEFVDGFLNLGDGLQPGRECLATRQQTVMARKLTRADQPGGMPYGQVRILNDAQIGQIPKPARHVGQAGQGCGVHRLHRPVVWRTGRQRARRRPA
jgi:hypothetical protein